MSPGGTLGSERATARHHLQGGLCLPYYWMMMALGPPKPPAHAPLALRRSGLVMWTPSHPCNAQQNMAAGNELAWTPEVGCVESVDGHSSSTTPPVCTTKGGENGRRKVHEVAEHHDVARVERRQQIPVQFATAYNSKRTSKQMRKLPTRKRWSLLDHADFAWCYMQARSST